MFSRTDIEKAEYSLLQPGAAKAAESKGRLREEPKCDIRTDFQRDRDRIIHSKAFRRLMHKTQVFLAPVEDHYRTRLTHTLEVAQIARTISRGLRLNEDLTEAIALGHDLGHTPFGHNGEAALDEMYPGGFRHNEQSLRVVDALEKTSSGRGMNLTLEVRDGILNHTGDVTPMTLEGQVVKISDRVAYINHDIDDALRSGIISECDLPAEQIDYLGKDHRTRINTLVYDLINTSDGKDAISQSEEAAYHLNELRSFMFRNVYYNKSVQKAASDLDVDEMIRFLYVYYIDHFDEVPGELKEMSGLYDREELVKDHIASMTDRYAINKYKQLKNE